MNNIMLDKPITIFGDGLQTRAFSYIDDVAPYIAKSCEMPTTVNQIINIGADKPYTVKELAELILKEMDADVGIVFYPERKEVKHAYSDHSKAKKIFNITKTVSLEEGMKKMVAWSKEIGPLEPSKFGKIEIHKNMPPSWKSLLHKEEHD
jgi:UDP-glucose 4-epimerase